MIRARARVRVSLSLEPLIVRVVLLRTKRRKTNSYRKKPTMTTSNKTIRVPRTCHSREGRTHEHATHRKTPTTARNGARRMSCARNANCRAERGQRRPLPSSCRSQAPTTGRPPRQQVFAARAEMLCLDTLENDAECEPRVVRAARAASAAAAEGVATAAAAAADERGGGGGGVCGGGGGLGSAAAAAA